MTEDAGRAGPGRRTIGQVVGPASRRVPDRVLPVLPGRLRSRAEETRLDEAQALAREDPEAALALLRPLVGGPRTATASRQIAQILLGQQRAEQALQVLEAAADTAGDDPRFLLLHARLLRERGDTERAAATMDRLVTLVPPGQQALERTVQELRFAPPELAVRLRDTIAASPAASRLDSAALEDLLVVWRVRVAADAGPEAIEEVLAEVRASRPEPLAVIARALAQVGAWDLLAAELDRSPQDGAAAPLWRLRKSASRALLEGHLTAAGTLARFVLRREPDDTEMRDVVASSEDQLRVLTSGWVEDEVPAQPHDPEPDAVLALLGQSLPLRSGGYATRSHGILTSLASRGWRMAAATRLGFPYDLWWSADDERAVAPVDVVDGVPYHRLLEPGVREYPRVPLADYVRRGAEMATEVAREHRAGLVHAASLSDVGLVGMRVARRLDVPFVYELRGLKQLLEDARLPRFAGSEGERTLDVLESTVARGADRLLVITEALGAEMVRLGVDPARITVVPNGVHVDRFSPRPRDTALEAQLGLTGRTVIGYAGGLVRYEGLDLLLEATGLLRRGRRDFHVLIVGDGADERHLHAQARGLGIGDVVTFTGRVPHHEVERYLSLVDITPFPRLPLRVCELVSPIKPFEAMAMAKAVVVSDVAALTEIVADGDTGRHFTKGDAADLAAVLGELVADPAERERLGRRARDWVVRHRDWARVTDRVDAVYRELLPASRS